MNNTAYILEAKGLCQRFEKAGHVVEIIKDVALGVASGEIVSLEGQSGSGKSTLLHALGLLEKPFSGEVIVDGKSSVTMGDREKTRIRRDRIGFIYQYHFLMADFSALENIIIPQLIAGKSAKDAKKRALELLDSVGLSHRIENRPGELSGGEQQRVAIARALANKPAIILADEPTGNLDPQTGEKVFGLLLDIVRHENMGALIVTHNPELAKKCDRHLILETGRVITL